jgi:NTE family protein
VEWDGRKLIDGGLSSNTPVTDAVELGAERVYVLPTGTACELPEAPHSTVATLLHAMSLLVMRRLLVEIDALSDRAALIVLPPPCPQAITPIDFSHTDELIRRGHESACEYLDGVEAPLAPRSVGVLGAELGEPITA